MCITLKVGDKFTIKRWDNFYNGVGIPWNPDLVEEFEVVRLCRRWINVRKDGQKKSEGWAMPFNRIKDIITINSKQI